MIIYVLRLELCTECAPSLHEGASVDGQVVIVVDAFGESLYTLRNVQAKCGCRKWEAIWPSIGDKSSERLMNSEDELWRTRRGCVSSTLSEEYAVALLQPLELPCPGGANVYSVDKLPGGLEWYVRELR